MGAVFDTWWVGGEEECSGCLAKFWAGVLENDHIGVLGLPRIDFQVRVFPMPLGSRPRLDAYRSMEPVS